jgi:hypothetical protein
VLGTLGAWTPLRAAVENPEPAMLRGTQFDLAVAAHAVDFPGRPSVATLVNGTLPGPVLRWRERDTITLRVRNALSANGALRRDHHRSAAGCGRRSSADFAPNLCEVRGNSAGTARARRAFSRNLEHAPTSTPLSVRPRAPRSAAAARRPRGPASANIGAPFISVR